MKVWKTKFPIFGSIRLKMSEPVTYRLRTQNTWNKETETNDAEQQTGTSEIEVEMIDSQHLFVIIIKTSSVYVVVNLLLCITVAPHYNCQVNNQSEYSQNGETGNSYQVAQSDPHTMSSLQACTCTILVLQKLYNEPNRLKSFVRAKRQVFSWYGSIQMSALTIK